MNRYLISGIRTYVLEYSYDQLIRDYKRNVGITVYAYSAWSAYSAYPYTEEEEIQTSLGSLYKSDLTEDDTLNKYDLMYNYGPIERKRYRQAGNRIAWEHYYDIHISDKNRETWIPISHSSKYFFKEIYLFTYPTRDDLIKVI